MGCTPSPGAFSKWSPTKRICKAKNEMFYTSNLIITDIQTLSLNRCFEGAKYDRIIQK